MWETECRTCRMQHPWHLWLKAKILSKPVRVFGFTSLSTGLLCFHYILLTHFFRLINSWTSYVRNESEFRFQWHLKCQHVLLGFVSKVVFNMLINLWLLGGSQIWAEMSDQPGYMTNIIHSRLSFCEDI